MTLTPAQKKILTALAAAPGFVMEGSAFPRGMNGNALRKLMARGLVAGFKKDATWAWERFEITEAGRIALAQ